MRLLVIGGSGLVGSEVLRTAPAGWEKLGVARKVDGLATRALDLLDPAAIDATLQAFSPELVVIASAWPWVDGCETDPERSHRENVETVENLVRALGAAPTRLVFFSTEHVFDGQLPAYDEQSLPLPLSVYARHKLEVEELLLERGHALIARTSYVFGVEARRKNFLYRVVDASRERTPLKVPSRQAGLPTWSRWLASESLRLSSAGVDGLVHLVGPEVLTKGEWAARIRDQLQLPNVQVLEVRWQESGQVAPRPERVVLTASKRAAAHPPLDAVLRDIAQEVC
jgi:dTDP-4-dehydrorhamnose reductase